MNINELEQLHQSGALRRVAFHRTFNHRQLKVNQVFVTFVTEQASGSYGEVTFMLEHSALTSELLTRQLLDNAGVPYSFSDLTAPLGQPNNTTPDEQHSGPTRGAGVSFMKPCGVCGKQDFDDSRSCMNPAVYTAAGDWHCLLQVAS
ncbi:hypothetical protein [Rheinheimera sp.]|uniref:hypothetical protein n=1 Tax=Rheinheimera sp. TaxID=1869214 RepID=UPI00307D07B2